MVIRHDVYPKRVVAFMRMAHEPYPEVIRKAKGIRMRYSAGYAAHDAQGIGTVITDYIGGDWEDYKARNRAELFGDFLIAIQKGELECPVVNTVYDDFKYCVYKDLYTPSGHPPDSMYATALAWTGVSGRLPGNAKKPGKVGKVRQIVF